MSRSKGAGEQPRESGAAQQSVSLFHLMNDNTLALTTLRGASGKSALFKLIGGLAAPSTGTIDCPQSTYGANGTPEQSLGPTLFPWRTVAGNVHLPLMLAGMSRRQTRLKGLQLT
jgi:ABC-type nitrate/sulfonate/bicarbonate transport system ATPase subunit